MISPQIPYSDDVLRRMMRELERGFPTVTFEFPTENLSDMFDDPDMPEEACLELGRPFLNRRWVDVTEEEWHVRDSFAWKATIPALAYFLPSVMRFSYGEDLQKSTRYVARLESWMMAILLGLEGYGMDRSWCLRRARGIYCFYSMGQIDLVEQWIRFENRWGGYDVSFGLHVLAQSRMRKDDNYWKSLIEEV